MNFDMSTFDPKAEKLINALRDNLTYLVDKRWREIII